MKLNLGCGDIYLEGYINIDIQGESVSMVSEFDLQQNKTTLDNYFRYSFESPRRLIIRDMQMDLVKHWQFKTESITEIVMISCLEHFSKKEGLFIISEVKRVLKSGGTFIVSVPDIKAQVDLFYDKDPKWCMELIYCNGKNNQSFHKYGYTSFTFLNLWEVDGYKVVSIDLIKHDYPMLQYKVTKL